jgi:hypothetical protein
MSEKNLAIVISSGVIFSVEKYGGTRDCGIIDTILYDNLQDRCLNKAAEEDGAQQGKKETISLAIHKKYRLLLIYEHIGLQFRNRGHPV